VTGAEFGHGFRLLELATVGSTNDVARDLAEAGEPAGLFVRAECQTAGRGRQGRVWQSPPGNLYASLLLRPSRPAAEVASLSLVVALALAEAVELLTAGSVRPSLKWPNDVQVDGAKLAGILLETTHDQRGGCAWLIVGVGANVGWAPAGDLPYAATCLAALGARSVSPRRLLAGLAETLHPQLELWDREGFAALRAGWLARAAGLGRLAEVRVGGEELVRGRLLDVDGAGALRLERADGTAVALSAGEVVLG
jgi:BirA family transcriptional regulator, biotin operon repressor / biotin---[acetyl-CoA-carboxylase] ligase